MSFDFLRKYFFRIYPTDNESWKVEDDTNRLDISLMKSLVFLKLSLFKVIILYGRGGQIFSSAGRILVKMCNFKRKSC